jgi:hypothetical protein
MPAFNTRERLLAGTRGLAECSRPIWESFLYRGAQQHRKEALRKGTLVLPCVISVLLTAPRSQPGLSFLVRRVSHFHRVHIP